VRTDGRAEERSEASTAGAPGPPLDRVRACALAMQLLERELREAVQQARREGVDSMQLATAAGVARATLYRRFLASEGGSAGDGPVGGRGAAALSRVR
jgi:hypothetical protein